MRLYPFECRWVGVFVTLGFVAVAPLAGADFTVNITGDLPDAVPGDGFCRATIGFKLCSLRAAVQENIALGGGGTITLPAGRYTLSIPGSGEDAAATGDLDYPGPSSFLTIEGAGADNTVVDAAGIDRVFHVLGDTGLILKRLTVTGGSALDSSGVPAGVGGGILVADGALLNLEYVRVADNKALSGGGIGGWQHERIRVENSEIVRNQIQLAAGSTSLGGAIYVDNPSAGGADITYSTISDNGCLTQPASECAGGVSAVQCGSGPSDRLEVNNCTVSGNEGHGVSVGACGALIKYATIYANSGIGFMLNDSGPSPQIVYALLSILANNGIQDCSIVAGDWNPLVDGNLSSDSSCGFGGLYDLVNIDPELYALGYHPPSPPSIAPAHHPRWLAPIVDRNPSSTVGDDQDGFPRGVDGNQDGVSGIDFGSIEAAPCVAAVDPVISNITLTAGTQEACNTLTADPNVVINGFVVFEARDSVKLGNGFEVTGGSELSVLIIRDAGAP